jgi:hypothetical protein
MKSAWKLKWIFDLFNALHAERVFLRGYSSLRIAINRRHAAKWLFPQEKSTFQCP